MKRLVTSATLIAAIVFSFFGCSDEDHNGPIQKGSVGWAIGQGSDDTAAILYTDNRGRSWAEQGDPDLWKGMSGNDISAVADHGLNITRAFSGSQGPCAH